MRSLVLKLMVAFPLFATAVQAFAQQACDPSFENCLPEPAALELLAIGGVALIAATIIKRRARK